MKTDIDCLLDFLLFAEEKVSGFVHSHICQEISAAQMRVDTLRLSTFKALNGQEKLSAASSLLQESGKKLRDTLLFDASTFYNFKLPRFHNLLLSKVEQIFRITHGLSPTEVQVLLDSKTVWKIRALKGLIQNPEPDIFQLLKNLQFDVRKDENSWVISQHR